MPTVFSTTYCGNKIYYSRVINPKGNKTIMATEVQIIRKKSLLTFYKPKKVILLAGFTKSYNGIFKFDKTQRNYWIKCFDDFIKSSKDINKKL
jgi:hypothetical protein